MRSYKVLIIDDSEISRAVLKAGMRRFQDLEMRVVGVAKNGNEGIWLAKTAHPDVITLDLDMPGMDGLTCLMELLANDPKLNVIVISNLAETEQAKECLVYGAKKVIAKQGLSVEKLQTAVAEIIRYLEKSSDQE